MMMMMMMMVVTCVLFFKHVSGVTVGESEEKYRRQEERDKRSNKLTERERGQRQKGEKIFEKK